ncbi:helix-turn-helix domain-containing protein, partial [Stenotrophomonas sp. P5_B8]
MDALKRRKQPARVRAALLDAVAQEAAQRGLGGVTVVGVAERAGVSKGALFHHFANRQQLLEAAYADGLLRFGDELDAILARDTLAHGRFTR